MEDQGKIAPSVHPCTFSHIGITVPDLDKAYKFYSTVMGWYVLVPPTLVKEDPSAEGEATRLVFGEGFKEFRVCHLSTADRVGVEIFEFPHKEKAMNQYNPFRTSIFHFAVQTPDIEGMVKRILEAGGKQLMPIKDFQPGKKPYRLVYMEDPFGNTIEILTHSYELLMAADAYKDYAKKR